MNGPHGPRASILRVGVCEPLPDGVWFLTGWRFDPRGDLSLIRPCPYLHDDDHTHIGFMGWTWDELRAISGAEMELAGLETTNSPS